MSQALTCGNTEPGARRSQNVPRPATGVSVTGSNEKGELPLYGPDEWWAPYPGARNYFFSAAGRVRSVDRTIKGKRYTGQILAQRPSNRPPGMPPERRYRLANIILDDGTRKTVTVHAGVALSRTAGGRRPVRDGVALEVCHNDDHGGHNWFANLRWDDPDGNRKDRYGEPAPPKPARLCILCGDPVKTNGKRCTPCVDLIGANAAIALSQGHEPAVVAQMLDYPHEEGLIRLAIKHGYGQQRPSRARRVKAAIARRFAHTP